jgi:ABC-type transport system involved in multi-copper enzyme maturation permease subunit
VRPSINLPLLGKELIELSARPRTHVLRSLTALLMLLLFWDIYTTVASEVNAFSGMLGHGRELFERLFWTLASLLLLIAPAASAGLITIEKEQGSLTTLLLTPMRPWELLLQKWTSRQIAIAGLLLPALPLFAVCYGYGGFAGERIAAAALMLATASAQAGAAAVAASCWCRTTIGATIAAYLLLAAMLSAAPIMALVSGQQVMEAGGWWFVQDLPSLDPFAAGREQSLNDRYGAYWGWSGARATRIPVSELAYWLQLSWPTLASIPVLLVIARLGLVRRASATGSAFLLRTFRRMDAWFNAAERRWGRQVTRELPEDEPVAWREVNRRALANTRYLVRLFLPLEVLAITVSLVIAADWSRLRLSTYITLVDTALVLASLAMLALGTGIVASERTAQTLEVLMTTPMTAREILAQKRRALRRVHGLFFAIIASIIGIKWFVVPSMYWDQSPLPSWLLEGVAAIALPAAAGWIGVYACLSSSRRGRALALALALTAAWTLLPLLAAAGSTWLSISDERDSIPDLLRSLSPMYLIDTDELGTGITTMAAVASPIAVCLAARLWVRRRADALLRRGAAHA